jgi:hypothetical protein
MKALDAAGLLDVWERGAPLGPSDRALLLLGRARPDLPADALGAVPIGRRDAELVRLRRALFGSRMTAIVSCPACAEPLELDIDLDAIAASVELSPEPSDSRDAAERRVPVVVGEREVSVRIPGTDDLVAAVASALEMGGDIERSAFNPQAAIRRALIARLVDDPGDLDTDGFADTVSAAILDADPGAEIRLAVTCACCGHAWDTDLDIASYLWTELEHTARRIAADVAGLAAAYGWREPDALALTPWRRELYLALAAG